MIHKRTIILLFVLMLWAAAGACAVADQGSDSIDAWKKWKSIDSAVVLRPLDGPEDILEKAEIIEDRTDELKTEKVRLENWNENQRKKLNTLYNQREILRDLSEIKMGGDTQIRQRLHDLTERIRREEIVAKSINASVAELDGVLVRMINLATEYREKARLLKLKEGGAP